MDGIFGRIVDKVARNTVGLRRFCCTNRSKIFIIVALFVLFQQLYSWQAVRLSGRFDEYDTYFGYDTPRVVSDLTFSQADHYKSSVHPFFVLLFNPLGSLLRHFCGSVETAVLMGSFAGAIGVCLAYLYFLLLGLSVDISIVLTILFGFLVSQNLVSSVPETYIYSSLSIIIVQLLGLSVIKKIKSGNENIGRAAIIYFPLAVVFTFAVTITNVFQGVIVVTVVAMLLKLFKTKIVYDFERPFYWILLSALILAVLITGHWKLSFLLGFNAVLIWFYLIDRPRFHFNLRPATWFMYVAMAALILVVSLGLVQRRVYPGIDAFGRQILDETRWINVGTVSSAKLYGSLVSHEGAGIKFQSLKKESLAIFGSTKQVLVNFFVNEIIVSKQYIYKFTSMKHDPVVMLTHRFDSSKL